MDWIGSGHKSLTTIDLRAYLLFFVVDSVCLSVCLTVTNIDSSFLFLDGVEPFFGRQFSTTKTTKRCSSNFDLAPLTPKIYSPKFAYRSLSQP